MDPRDSRYTIKADLHYFIKYTILMFICLLFFCEYAPFTFAEDNSIL